MSKLLDMQQLFAQNIGKLIAFAYLNGMELTFGESFDDDGIGHMKNSNHYIRLAQDFCLFKDDKYLTESDEYEILGSYWKTLYHLNRWGGDFKSQDGNHFSMEFEGRK
jgi:hypothetical protein